MIRGDGTLLGCKAHTTNMLLDRQILGDHRRRHIRHDVAGVDLAEGLENLKIIGGGNHWIAGTGTGENAMDDGPSLSTTQIGDDIGNSQG